jgi:hypothetical protein
MPSVTTDEPAMFSRTNVNSRQYLPVHSNFRAGMPGFRRKFSGTALARKRA